LGLGNAVFLGIIQGLTEILPISSSGHLILAPWLFHFTDPGLSFDVALHLGTMLAIGCFFFSDILNILKGGIGLITKKDVDDFHQRLFVLVAIATVPGVIAGVFLDKYAESAFRSPLLIASTLSIFAFVLLAADRLAAKPKTLEKLNIPDSVVVGLSQALAIIPGVSRSGITITAGLSRKLSREDAARLSFILSFPISLGAAVFKLRHLTASAAFSSTFIAGILTSFITSILTIKFLLNFVRKHNFSVFVYYRIFVAIAIILIYFVRR
jgi:undecaprenyl-diphosphatase